MRRHRRKLWLRLPLVGRFLGFAGGYRCLTGCREGHTFGPGCLRRNW